MKEIMKGLDDELKNALRREHPPAGFAERVLRRVGEQAPAEPGAGRPVLQVVGTRASHSNRAYVRWAAAAALVAAVAGGIQYRTLQKERAEGEAAKARVVLALQIASSKLQLVQMKINRLHEQPEKNTNQ